MATKTVTMEMVRGELREIFASLGELADRLTPREIEVVADGLHGLLDVMHQRVRSGAR